MDVDKIVADVLSSKKYSSVDPSLVRRICTETVYKYPKKKEILKAIKNILYVNYDVYLQSRSFEKAHALLSQLTLGFNDTQHVDIALQIMQLHTSSKERLGDIREVCSFLNNYISLTSSVMDIGCGFNPFVLPLLHEFPAAYFAYDICLQGVDILNKYFSIIKKGTYKAMLLDAVSATPQEKVDIVFLFKLVPLLQQQKKGRGFSILEELHFGKAIVSFPTKSLGGKNKGMETFYSELFEDNLPSSLDIVEKQSFSNEMFYVIQQNKIICGGK